MLRAALIPKRSPERVAVEGEHRTFMVTEELPSEVLTARPHSLWHSVGMMIHVQ
jgi:hypothetical protein